MRLAFLAVFAAMLSVPGPADAGPLSRLRDRLHQRHALPSAPAPVPAQIPDVMPGPARVVGAAPKAAATDHETHRRILLDFARHHAAEKAFRDGVKMPDGTVRKLTRQEAKEHVARISDETILAHAKSIGAPLEGVAVGDGGGKLQALLQWLWDHKDEIIAFIMKILPLFLVAHLDTPSGTVLVAVLPGGWVLLYLIS